MPSKTAASKFPSLAKQNPSVNKPIWIFRNVCFICCLPFGASFTNRQARMATANSGYQAKNIHSKVYSLGGNRRDEPAKQNPWHKYCKEYAQKNNISYAAAISLASPSWRAHKEKNGLQFRDRSRRSQQQQQESSSMDDEEENEGRCPVPPIQQQQQQSKSPRKPKETHRKDTYKREREEGEGGCDDRRDEYHLAPPKKKKVPKPKKDFAQEDFERYQEFLRHRAARNQADEE